MKSSVLVLLLACAMTIVAGTAGAQSTPAPDTSAVAADSTEAPPVPASAAPATTTTAAPPPASAPATTTAPPPSTPPPATAPAQESKRSDRIYYGGTATFSFGSTSTIGIYPMIGYKLTPRLSVGGEVGYEYVNWDGESTHNYGTSVFGRALLRRGLFAMAELRGVNYEVPRIGGSEREWVPFVMLGGGFSKPMGPRTSIYAEVLFDVLQDEDSPYADWEPHVTVGVGVGM